MTIAVTSNILSGLSPSEAAALWKVQADSGSLVEAGLFEVWLSEDEAHARAWDQLGGAWSVFDDADDPMFADLRAAALLAGRTTRPWSQRRILAATAAVVALVGGGALVLPRQAGVSVTPTGQEVAAQTVYQAGMRPRTIALADGSQVTLDANARVRVAIAVGARQVVLERGRALFAVKHDQSKPFRVMAGTRTVVDLGTRFEVSLAAETVRVALFEGSVRVDGGQKVQLLVPGQILETVPGDADKVSSASGGEPVWSEGLVQFDQTTLAEAAEKLNADSDIKLVIDDARVAQMRVSGRFRLRDPARFAATVSEILPVKVVRVGRNRIEMRYKR